MCYVQHERQRESEAVSIETTIARNKGQEGLEEQRIGGGIDSLYVLYSRSTDCYISHATLSRDSTDRATAYHVRRGLRIVGHVV